MRARKHIPWCKQVTIGFILIFGLSTILLHASEAKALSIELTNYNIIDFGEMNPGDIKDDVPPDGLVVRCTASSGTSGWTLKIKIDHPLTHVDNPASIIPNTNFKWYVESTSDTDNTSANINQREEITTYDKTAYTGATSEEQTNITLKFQLELPPALQWGTYNTSYGHIILTLTE